MKLRVSTFLQRRYIKKKKMEFKEFEAQDIERETKLFLIFSFYIY